MMNSAESPRTFALKHPDLTIFLDDHLPIVSEGEEFSIKGTRFLIVTQYGEYESGQTLFEFTSGQFHPVASDTIIDLLPTFSSNEIHEPSPGTDDIKDQTEKFYQYQLSEVDRFKTHLGPAGGALACVWALRHLAKNVLGRWITKTDSTATLARELRNQFDSTFSEKDLPAGSIIISPTIYSAERRKTQIGHVGVLGGLNADGDRLIYSNSSKRKVWQQSHTLTKWRDYYQSKKGLKVLFYPLPSSGKL